MTAVFATERRRRILEHVRANGSANLRDLVVVVNASETTVRRDLQALDAQGLLDRRRDGTAIPTARPVDAARTGSGSTTTREKYAIAVLAATLVEDGDAVVLGAGTTTQQLAARLVDVKDLTVVTNSLVVGEVLGRSAEAAVVMTGGSLRGSTLGLVGSGAEQSLADLRVRRAFLSGDGLTSTWGLSTADLSEVGVDRAIADAAQELVVLVDHMKLGVDAMFQTVSPERIAHLITDELADPELLRAFTEIGIQVHVAPFRSAQGPAAEPASTDPESEQ